MDVELKGVMKQVAGPRGFRVVRHRRFPLGLAGVRFLSRLAIATASPGRSIAV